MVSGHLKYRSMLDLFLLFLSVDRPSMLARSRHITLLATITTYTLPALLLIGYAAHSQTVTETFAMGRLSATEIHEIIAAVEQTAYDTPDSWENELRVARVDLGGSNGLVVICFAEEREIARCGYFEKWTKNGCRC